MRFLRSIPLPIWVVGGGTAVVAYTTVQRRAAGPAPAPASGAPLPSGLVGGLAPGGEAALVSQGAGLALQGAGLGLQTAERGLGLAETATLAATSVAGVLAGSQAQAAATIGDLAGTALAILPSFAPVAGIQPQSTQPQPAPAPAPAAQSSATALVNRAYTATGKTPSAGDLAGWTGWVEQLRSWGWTDADIYGRLTTELSRTSATLASATALVNSAYAAAGRTPSGGDLAGWTAWVEQLRSWGWTDAAVAARLVQELTQGTPAWTP